MCRNGALLHAVLQVMASKSETREKSHYFKQEGNLHELELFKLGQVSLGFRKHKPVVCISA